MSCKVKVRRHKTFSVIHVSGDMIGSDSAVVSEKILAQGTGRGDKIFVDLSEATFLDSHGLGVLVYAWRMLEEQGRELVFLSPPPFVRDIFKGTNLNNIFRIVDDVESR